MAGCYAGRHEMGGSYSDYYGWFSQMKIASLRPIFMVSVSRNAA
jgi:hypothetical protein